VKFAFLMRSLQLLGMFLEENKKYKYTISLSLFIFLLVSIFIYRFFYFFLSLLWSAMLIIFIYFILFIKSVFLYIYSIYLGKKLHSCASRIEVGRIARYQAWATCTGRFTRTMNQQKYSKGMW